MERAWVGRSSVRQTRSCGVQWKEGGTYNMNTLTDIQRTTIKDLADLGLIKHQQMEKKEISSKAREQRPKKQARNGDARLLPIEIERFR
ncbi:hypothetical protein L6452_15714 [Arctium lappa]|uniref:Uncharacterized protein n=1 Tax=Arctium lappa TaxID=4217 RepID=A0ACB9CPB5_ARCLA|nr:hypothetical protein L6452_15714 [Arctium lappa]